MVSIWTLSFFFLVSLVQSANNTISLDPVKNFCKRVQHQSTVKNGVLYIDGGIEVFTGKNNYSNPTEYEIIGYNEYLLKVDMSKSWDWTKAGNLSVNVVNKTANPSTGTTPPNAVRAALYQGAPSDSSIYLYGGTISYENTSFPGWVAPTTANYALWSYDTSSKTWDQYDFSLSVAEKPNAAAYAEAPELGLAFSLGGAIDTGTSNALQPLSNFRALLPGLVVINTNNQTARNLSTGSLPEAPRERGGMAYIPEVGTKGILVALGGVTKDVADANSKNAGTYIDMAQIDVFDVGSLDTSANGSWYRQKATGQVPASRADFCLVVATAPDDSSYNIYLYGGINEKTAYDDVYILSLPSFIWTKIYSGQSPRFSHTCHFVGNRQMVTVGGANDTEYGRGCDWETSSVAIYDLTTLSWGSVFDVNAAPYQVPAPVYGVIGGGPAGNATATAPKDGFVSIEFAQLFSVQGSNNGASSEGSKGISGGAIAGAVVGSVVGAAVLVGLLFVLIKQRRRAGARGQEGDSQGEKSTAGGVTRRPQELESSMQKATGELPARSLQELHTPQTVLHEMPGAEQHFAELDSQPHRPRNNK